MGEFLKYYCHSMVFVFIINSWNNFNWSSLELDAEQSFTRNSVYFFIRCALDQMDFLSRILDHSINGLRTTSINKLEHVHKSKSSILWWFRPLYNTSEFLFNLVWWPDCCIEGQVIINEWTEEKLSNIVFSFIRGIYDILLSSLETSSKDTHVGWIDDNTWYNLSACYILPPTAFWGNCCDVQI